MGDPAKDIFVFGSDLAGRHAEGDALIALRDHGAVYGRAVGLQGRSYAIPVRDENGKPLPVPVIARYVKAFLRFAEIHREMTFHVTRIGCGHGAHRNEDIAPLFAGAAPNCRLPPGWRRIVERRAATGDGGRRDRFAR
ncbi:MAG: hypothetical protein ACK4V1_09235 [Burkholderiaceae bacterium]